MNLRKHASFVQEIESSYSSPIPLILFFLHEQDADEHSLPTILFSTDLDATNHSCMHACLLGT